MDKFRFSFKHLFPIIITLLVSCGLGFLLKIEQIKSESVTIFPETPTGATLNSIIFIIIIATMATVIYGLIKFGFQQFVKKLIKITLSVAVFMLLIWYGSAFFKEGILVEYVFIFFLFVTITGLLIISLYHGNTIMQICSSAIIASLIGGFLGLAIPLLTSIILLLGLSVYDVISVYKGPIGKIAEQADFGTFLGAVINYEDLTIGMGDLVFYSLLINTTLFNFGVNSMLTASIGVLIGSMISLKILEKKDLFPGLPLPIILGIIFALIIAII